MVKNSYHNDTPSPSDQEMRDANVFFNKYGAYLLIAGSIIYLVLLIAGLIAEMFDIQTILDWWIWSPSGN